MWPGFSVYSLLESDHVELDRLLHETTAAIESTDVVRTFECLDLFWARLAMHIRAEHRWLFPTVREIAERSPEAFDRVPAVLDMLRQDHDFFMRDLARAVKAMRLVFCFGNEAETLVVVRELLEGVRERLEIHNRIEEERIYTLTAEKFLDLSTAEQLLYSIKKELVNYPHRFAQEKRDQNTRV
jgi:hypothetical protein